MLLNIFSVRFNTFLYSLFWKARLIKISEFKNINLLTFAKNHLKYINIFSLIEVLKIKKMPI